MNEPEPQLDDLRRGYRARRYGGDLAADLGVAPSRFRPAAWWGAGALAAAVLLAGTAFWIVYEPDTPGGAGGIPPEVVQAPEAPKPPVPVAVVEAPASTNAVASAKTTTAQPGARVSGIPNRPTRFDVPVRPKQANLRWVPRRFPGLPRETAAPEPPPTPNSALEPKEIRSC